MSAQSTTSIANRALQMCGAASILNLTDNSREARAANNCYDACRRAELRAHRWNFSIKRVQLAPSSDTPLFDYGYSYPLPVDCMYVPRTNDACLDWSIEGRAILSNDGPVLNLRYVADITDPGQFDAAFCEALAARMALEMVEALTQSNQKKQMLADQYKQTLMTAALANALEKAPADPPDDPWVTAHES